MTHEIRKIMNKIMEASQYDRERGEYYPDFGNENTYDHYIEEVVNDFDFDDFVHSVENLYWDDLANLHGVADEDRELYSNEIMDEITAYLEKKLVEIDPVYAGQDMAQFSKSIFDEIRPKLEQAGYKFKDLNESHNSELTHTPANHSAGNFSVRTLSPNAIPHLISAKISIFYDFDMLGDWQGKINQIVVRLIGKLKDSITKYGNYNGIVVADEKTGEITMVTDEDLKVGAHYHDGDIEGIVLAVVEKE